MIGKIFGNIISFLKSTAPTSIIINVVLGAVLLIIGIIFLRKQQRTNRQKIGGYICVSISVLAFLGAVSNWIFSYLVF